MLKAIFIGGVILGLAATVGAAGYYPWIDHPRPPSRTQVVPNGGRLELFTIRLPADRIAAAGNAALSSAGASFPADEALPSGPAAESLRIEQFKLRDAVGDVVGLAARHTLVLDSGPTVAWTLTLPSRGSIWLSGSGAAPAGGASGQIDGGSGEFQALHGSYDERWQIAADAAGGPAGTIELATTTFLN